MDAVSRHAQRKLVLAAVAGFLLVVGAVALEVLAGMSANSPVPVWAERVVPLAWPAPARVAWWLGVAGAALVFRVALHRLGFRQHRVVVLLSVAPFVAFAIGIGLGADWATWH